MRVKILVLLLTLLSVTVVSAASMSFVDSDGDPLEEDVYGGESLEVKVLVDGKPVEGVDVYFILNDGAPIHTATNEDGLTVFKPLQTGNLEIKAMEDEDIAGKRLTVVVKPEETPTPTPTVRRSGGGGGGGGGLPLQLTSTATPTPTPTPTEKTISIPPMPSTPQETPEETPTVTPTSTPQPTPTVTPTPFWQQPTVTITIAAVIIAAIIILAYTLRKK